MSTHTVIARFTFDGNLIEPGEVEIDLPEAMLEFLIHNGCIAAPENWPEPVCDASYHAEAPQSARVFVDGKMIEPGSKIDIDLPDEVREFLIRRGVFTIPELRREASQSAPMPSRKQIRDVVFTALRRAGFQGKDPSPSGLAKNLLFLQVLDHFRLKRADAAEKFATDAAKKFSAESEKQIRLSQVFRSLEGEGGITVNITTDSAEVKISGDGVNERLRQVFGTDIDTNNLSTPWSRYIKTGGSKTVILAEQRETQRVLDYYKACGFDLIDEIAEAIDSAADWFEFWPPSNVVTTDPRFSD